MSQARQKGISREAGGEDRRKIKRRFFFSRLPRLAHKAPAMQASPGQIRMSTLASNELFRESFSIK